MQSETAGFYQTLTKQLVSLNQEIEDSFVQFSKRPIKVKHFSPQQKALTRSALLNFECSEDEEQVDLEGIQLGDGTYDKVACFAKNVRKLHKLIDARLVISSLKDESKHTKVR